MKLLIASDIHGSADLVQQTDGMHIKMKKQDRMIPSGDILYHGPRNALPKEYDPASERADLLNQISDRILLR